MGQSVGPSIFVKKNDELRTNKGFISSSGEYPGFGSNIRGIDLA